MFVRPSLLFLGIVALAFAAPTALAMVDLPIDDGQGGGGQQDPGNPGPVTPDRMADEIKRNLERSTGDYNAPASPLGGGGHGIDDIPGGVTNALFEEPAVTAAITASLLGTVGLGFWYASRYIDPKIALQSPERSMLYGFVKGNPGVHLKQLSTEFRMKTSTVLWHVRKLESADLIRSKKANGYRVFYPVSGGMEASKVSEAITALSNVNARTIFAFLAEHPEAPLRDVTDRLGINAGTVRWHLKKLRRAGLLDEAFDRSLRVTELGVKAWNQLQGSPSTQVPVVLGSAEAVLEKSEELRAS
jgi:DNA-binding transcriptional ArsR family regulator